MTTLKNHLILFDAECPMCRVYTKAFVQSGILEHDGRAAYQDMDNYSCPMVDRQRAVNEIALVNKQTGEVSYGISSLFKIFAAILPALKPLFSFKPFIWVMSKIYAFISYNRRVIIPAAKTNCIRLQPTFNFNYRIGYLVFTWAVTSYILTAYAHLLTGTVPIGSSYREYLVCGGQIIFQGLAIGFVNRQKRWEYLGNMMTISFAGALLLLLVLLPSGLIGYHPLLYTVYFMLVAGLMLMEHIRRTKLLQLGWAPSITWVLYRVFILLVILY